MSDTWVNWCEGLGTVLANDEVKDGLSERGGFPVEQKLMKQWSLRITAYADRLISGLDSVDWSDSIKEIQRNWIGRSKGVSVHFDLENSVKKICDNIDTNEEKKQQEISNLIKKLPLERYCCKRIILTSVDIVKEILPINEN